MTNNKPTPNKLISIGEISNICDVSNSTASNWRTRYDDFPKPVYEFRRTRIYNRHQILNWCAKHGKLVTT